MEPAALTQLTPEQILELDVEETDRWLAETREAFLRADRHGTEAEACQAYTQLDRLLEHRLRIPQQRHPTD